MKIREIIISFIFLILCVPTLGRETSRITPLRPNEIYLGAVLKCEDINSFTGHTIIDVSLPKENIIVPSVWGSPIHKTELSRENMMKIIKGKLTDASFKKTETFNTKIIKLNGNYNRLMGTVGHKVNNYYFGVDHSVIFTKSALLLELSASYFEISIGLPVENEYYLDKEEIERLEKRHIYKDEIAYVSKIVFGRAVNIVIEANIEYADLEETVNNAFKGIPLNEKQKYIWDNATIIATVIGEEELPDDPKENIFDSIKKYFAKPVTANDFGVPIYMNLSTLNSKAYYNEY